MSRSVWVLSVGTEYEGQKVASVWSSRREAMAAARLEDHSLQMVKGTRVGDWRAFDGSDGARIASAEIEQFDGSFVTFGDYWLVERFEVQRFTDREDARGNDGLTRAERAAYAERWRNGAGKPPSKDDLKLLRGMAKALEDPVGYLVQAQDEEDNQR